MIALPIAATVICAGIALCALPRFPRGSEYYPPSGIEIAAWYALLFGCLSPALLAWLQWGWS